MKKIIVIWGAVLLFTFGNSKAGTWTTIEYPGADTTVITGINNNNVVGSYNQISGIIKYHGYLYDGVKWTTIDYPETTHGTVFSGIDNNSVIGWNMNGFLYDFKNSNWTLLNYPSAMKTNPLGISGTDIVGQYSNNYSDNPHGFLYDGLNWTTIDYPGAVQGTYLCGISSDTIVGYYEDASWLPHSFFYNLTNGNWTTLDKPGASFVEVQDIDGSNVVGHYSDASGTHGFLYNFTSGNWTTLDYPGANRTMVNGISGSNVFGSYETNITHGFIYTIPEPATLLLLGLGAVILRRKN